MLFRGSQLCLVTGIFEMSMPKKLPDGMRENMTQLTDTQKVLGPYAYYAKPGTLIVRANGGNVTLEVLADQAADIWIADQVFDKDGVHKVDVNNSTIRLSPAGGAAFSFVAG